MTAASVDSRGILAALAAAGLAAGGARAQNNDSFVDAERSSVRYSEARYSPPGACGDLVSETADGISILSARLEGADAGVPAHCRVTGVIPPEVLFEVNLPADWNGRFYMYGNGGFAGNPPAAHAGVRDQALRHGFATAYTNTGHDARRQPGASFAYNDLQKTLDYLFRAVHLTVLHSKALVAQYYGRAAEYAYWDGCSMGGRQGMLSAQRFPGDFDGIVAGSPAMDFTGTMLSYAWQSRLLEETPMRPEKLELLSEQVYARCDSLDGLRDGLIADPRRCDFAPEKHLPRCGGDGDDCFTTREIELLEKLYAGPVRAGRPLHPGLLPGTEVRGTVRLPDGDKVMSGWMPWLLRDGAPSFQRQMIESFLKYLAFASDDPAFTLADFSLDSYPDGWDPLTMELLDAKGADLRRFRDRGGKMLSYFGWADAAINPLPVIDYYESLESAMGIPPQGFYRLYMVPGMFHCDGGAGADDVDFMTPLIEWVEAGKVPTALIGRHAGAGKQFSRPQCPYPQTVRYKGSGPVEAAESFECAAPQRRAGTD